MAPSSATCAPHRARTLPQRQRPGVTSRVQRARRPRRANRSSTSATSPDDVVQTEVRPTILEPSPSTRPSRNAPSRWLGPAEHHRRDPLRRCLAPQRRATTSRRSRVAEQHTTAPARPVHRAVRGRRTLRWTRSSGPPSGLGIATCRRRPRPSATYIPSSHASSVSTWMTAGRLCRSPWRPTRSPGPSPVSRPGTAMAIDHGRRPWRRWQRYVASKPPPRLGGRGSHPGDPHERLDPTRGPLSRFPSRSRSASGTTASTPR